MPACARCGSSKKIHRHHKVHRIDGGSDDPDNIKELCQPCHSYEHGRARILMHLEYEYEMGQANRIALWEYRLRVLEGFNAVEVIRGRGKYRSYWKDKAARAPLPPPLRMRVGDRKVLTSHGKAAQEE